MTTADDVGIDALRAVWAESERRMYPLATVAPEKYERLIRLARQAANDLGDATSAAELAARWTDGPTIVDAASTHSGLPLGDLNKSDVAGVAFALRDLEVRAIDAQQKLAERISAATAAGDDWVVMHEKGDLEQGLIDPYQAVELHIPTGAAIVSSAEQNPADGRANYVLAVVRLDPVTGATTDLDPGIADTSEYDQLDEFRVSRVALRDLVAAWQG